MRDHVLTPLETMETQRRMQCAPTTCDEHRGKPLEYYCESHKQLGCRTCFMSEHTACIEVVCINGKRLSDTEEFIRLRIKLNGFTTRINLSKKRASMAGCTICQQCDQAVSDIQAAGTAMKEYIDRLVDAKIAEAQKIKKANLSTTTSITNINDEVKAKLKTTTESLEYFTKKANPRLLFITKLSIEQESHALESKIKEAEKLDIKGIKFLFNTQLSRTMEIGTLEFTDVSRVQSATQSFEAVHVLILPTSNVHLGLNSGTVYSPTFNVSVNRNINLSHIILRNQGFQTVTIGIREGETVLFECEHRYVKSSDEVEEVEIVQYDGRHGLDLQAEYTYTFTFEKVCGRNQYIARQLDQLPVMKEGVTFEFSSENEDVYTGPFEGIVFTLV